MKQTLTQLVDTILAKIQEQPERFRSESGLRSWLTSQGYAARDIEAALQLVKPGSRALPVDTRQTPAALRHLSGYERMKLTPVAQAALQRLDLAGLIEPHEREAILDRLDHFEGEVDLGALEYLVSWVVCSTRDVEHQSVIYQLLDGRTDRLH
jgi:uncharacterized protein Smg (DUF494 family)